ncbi:MAG: hypothetical protein ACLPSF_11550 [Methylocella sp.]
MAVFEAHDSMQAAAPTYIQPKYLILLVGLVLWVAFRIAYPNVLIGPDVYHFKDPGCNLALGHGFTSASYVGTDSFHRELWLSQGPIFPLLFGGFASLFGCGVDSNNMFDLAISALLCAEVLTLLPKSIDIRLQIAFAAVVALVLPTGGYEWPGDRPDHLALVFLLAMPIICNWRGISPASSLFLFLIAGLTFLISPYYGLVGGVLAVALAYHGSKLPLGQLAPLVAKGIAVAATPLLATIAIYALIDATSIARFTRHAEIIFDDASFVAKLKHALLSSGVSSVLWGVRWLLAIPFIAFVLASVEPRKDRLRQVSVPLALGLLVLTTPLIFPRQGNYFVAIAFVAVMISFWYSSTERVQPQRRAAIVVSGALILFAPLAPGSFFVLLRLLETRSSYFEERAQISANAAALRAAAGDKVVLVPASHYFLFKERVDNLFNPEYLFPGYNPSDIGATVACRTTRDGGDPFPPAFDVRPSSSIIAAPISPPLRLQLFGRPIARKYWDWGCDLIHY